MHKMKLFIVDDHKMFLEGIQSILEDVDTIDIVATAKNGEEALKLLKSITPDILITDIDMPIIDGIELTKTIRSQDLDIKIIALSSHYKSSVIGSAVQAGINGYILKNTGKAELIKALETVYNGENYFSENIRKIMMDSLFNAKETKKNKVNLSEREKEILLLIVQEKSTKKIAEQLFISSNTVETHRKNLMRKIGAKNMIGLAKYAIQQDLM